MMNVKITIPLKFVRRITYCRIFIYTLSYLFTLLYIPLLREYYIKMDLWLYNLPHDAVKYKWKKLIRLS
ncbi:unnamed protein product [Rhizophagus irregularis]|nr:unnamed protein product [Rhizophagus irregularis]